MRAAINRKVVSKLDVATQMTVLPALTLLRPHVLLPILALAIAGCGTSDTGQVSGVVTLNGQKVGGAELFFASSSNEDDQFIGIASNNGEYQVSYRTLDGLPVGKYTVRVSIHTLPNGAPFPPGDKADELRDDGKLVQRVFIFEKEVQGGQNTIDFELSEGQQE